MIKAPSGRIFDRLDLKICRLMARYGFIQWNDTPFKLQSGILSHVYVFGREDLTDHPDLEWRIGIKLAKVVRANSYSSDKQPCLIGIPTAGTALAQAAAMASQAKQILINGNVICHRIMREALKQHGAHQKWVNGSPQPEQHTYWTVDNVITYGQSKIEAESRLANDGYPDATHSDRPSLILIDRQQGGVQRLSHYYCFQRIVIVYQLLDLIFLFGELGLWPKEMIKAVEEEIKAHQLN